MGCKVNSSYPPILCKQIHSKKTNRRFRTFAFSSYNRNQEEPISTSTSIDTKLQKTDVYSVSFKTLEACKLGISSYPDFVYNARGGMGVGSGRRNGQDGLKSEISVCFDVNELYIPPLMSETTRFLGLPLPPFLKIDIVPELFQGRIDQESGEVELQFNAKFLFSIGSIYRAPPLLVETVLTSEESKGAVKVGKGERLDKEGKCRLVGVAKVDPIDDLFMNSFLGLPTECLADLNAIIEFCCS